MKDRKPTLLFACVHNAGRSQIAAAFAKKVGGDNVVVRSAGSAPAGSLHANVIAAMREAGIDLSAETPSLLTDDIVEAADVVVTMGCGDACPIYPGKRYEDWVIEDPAGASLEETRRIRDSIEARVTALIRNLNEAPPGSG